MLDPKLARQPAGVLRLANALTTERFNGELLRNLDPQYQRDMVMEARAMLERYREQ
jgi:hypothetical protein